MADVVDINLFGQELTLRKDASQVTTGEGFTERVFFRYHLDIENGFTVALMRDMESGDWVAYVNYEADEPQRRMNFWSDTCDEPGEAIASLQTSIIAAGQVLSNALHGRKPS